MTHILHFQNNENNKKTIKIHDLRYVQDSKRAHKK